MSKDIWHKPSETPKCFSYIIEHHKAYDFDNYETTDGYDTYRTSGNPGNPFDTETIKWAYLDDLLALESELERTRKALETAVSALKYIQDGNLGFSPAMDFAEKALEQITALEQKDK